MVSAALFSRPGSRQGATRDMKAGTNSGQSRRMERLMSCRMATCSQATRTRRTRASPWPSVEGLAAPAGSAVMNTNTLPTL